ncbi:universal stress protein [Dactylosporangium sp. NBC_01737]|uniref:universal stress protein n=1 Tax=Dactylosporangium sp. NBC_01737 TaxID=2975959 RepID=UPI002E0FC0E3|nr:universal stress protein [Dactylosporangium sp. NBC_01737]
MRHRDRAVIVGVDGSEAGLAAVRFAGAEAVLRGNPVELVAAFRPHPTMCAGRRLGRRAPAAHRRLVDAVAAVRVGHSQLSVQTALVMGDLADTLIARSGNAALVVVAEGGPTNAWQRIAGHCLAPVVLVRHGYQAGGPVVLGVDGVTLSAAAADFAYAEAALRGVPLVAVHVWTGLPATGLSTVDPFAYDLAVARSEADRVPAEGLAGWSEKFPDVLVERRVVLAANVGEELVRQAAGAAVLVVGARSSEARSDLLLGPVTRFAMLGAACPVAVLNPVPSVSRV